MPHLSQYKWLKPADLIIQLGIALTFLWLGFRQQNAEEMFMAGAYTLCWQLISCFAWYIFYREKRRYFRRLFEKLILLLLGAGLLLFAYGIIFTHGAQSGYLMLYTYYVMLLTPLLCIWYLALTLYELIAFRYAAE